MLRLPRKKIKIRGIFYKVVQVPASHPSLWGGSEEEQRAGTVDYVGCVIYIDKAQSIQHKWMIFWHEVVHIIVAGCGDMRAEDEPLVDIIGVEIFSICRQLGFLGNGG